MKINVLGFYNHKNIGDDSYQISLSSLFPQHHFEFFDKLPEKNNCDAIILGGGNVVKPYFLSQLEAINDIPIYGLSVGIEIPYSEKVKFKHIWARENFSVNLLQQMGV